MTEERAIEILTINSKRVSLFEAAEAVDMAVDALKEQIDRKWIPCSESLPEKDGDYLVSYLFCGEPEVGKSRFNTKCGFIYEYVHAWMPLPEPYKKEGNGK